MRPILIYFGETHLDENNKFTLDFPDHEFVQKIEFLSKRQILQYQLKLQIKNIFSKTKKLKNYLNVRNSTTFVNSLMNITTDLKFIFIIDAFREYNSHLQDITS